MRIVINHLTRMRGRHICVAGVEPETNRHVRPVLAGERQLASGLLASEGGLFDIAVEVDLGTTKPTPTPPEAEDHIFGPGEARLIRRLSDEEFWELLNAVAQHSLSATFGDPLRRLGATSAGVDVGSGTRSLGCLIPLRPPRIRILPRAGKPAQIRMQLTDGHFDLDLSVADLRLFAPGLTTPNNRAVVDLDRRLRRKVGVVLSVGLTRPFASSPDFPPVHWLQVNNVHLEDVPTWRIGVASQPQA